MDKIAVDFSDVKKTLDDLIEEQKGSTIELAMHQKIKRIIYLTAKEYTSKETAEKISEGCMDYLIALRVCIKTPISVKHNTGG